MAARKRKTDGNKNWIALDAGGTLADAVIVDAKGQFLVGKHLTNKQDESISFIGAKVGLMVTQGFEDYLLMEKGEGLIPIVREPTLLSFQTNIPMIHSDKSVRLCP